MAKYAAFCKQNEYRIKIYYKYGHKRMIAKKRQLEQERDRERGKRMKRFFYKAFEIHFNDRMFRRHGTQKKYITFDYLSFLFSFI